MWQATLTYKRREGDKIILNIEYTDGIELISDIITLTSAQKIEDIVRNRIQQLDKLLVYEKSLTVGLIDLTIPIPPPPPPLTQDQIDQQNYFTLLEKWTIAKVDIDKGLLDKTDPLFTKLDSDLKAAYKPEYSGL